MAPTKDDIAGLNFSQPVADLLREGTRSAHERAEHSRGAHWLTRGELDKEEYIRFLMMLWHVYDTFERALEQHATHPTLAPTHNPGLFARSGSLAADISYLLEVPETSWQAHPLHATLTQTPPPALSRYVGRIRELAASADPSGLLAHAYVRYLGDLSGGQFIRRRIAKAYGLEDGVGGLSFYEFRTLTGASGDHAGAGEMKRIKEWYRGGMNSGVGDDTALKAVIVEEASRAFEFNTALFDELKAPSKATAGSPSEYAGIPSPLHMPADSPLVTPAVEEVKNPLHSTEIKSFGEMKTVFKRPKHSHSGQWSYQASSVIAVVAVFSIAHFVLGIGGATSSQDTQLDVLQKWLGGFFGRIAQV